MIKKFFIVFIFITAFVSAQSSEALFDKANSMYQKEKYEEAILLYNSIIDNGDVSSELYYNIGNCFFKLNKVAPSIYSYEKAIQLDESNKEAKNNLVLANLLKVDRVKKNPNSFWQDVEMNTMQKLSFEKWGILAILFSFIGVACFIFYYFTLSPSKKRLFFIAICFSLFFMISFYATALHQYQKVYNMEFAIIYSKELKIKVEPVKTSENLHTLHEGEKVKIIDSIGDWKKIEIVNGKTGWLMAKNIKSL